MRWIVSLILTAAGVILLYLFTGGAFIGPESGLPEGDPWGMALSPLWRMTLQGAGVLFLGVAAIIFAGGTVCWSKDVRKTPGDPTGWSPILQAAFSMNVLIVAVVLLGLSVAMRETASLTTLGSLYVLALFLALFGSSLAFALLWLRKSRLLFASTLCVHLFEVGALTTVCLMGVGG